MQEIKLGVPTELGVDMFDGIIPRHQYFKTTWQTIVPPYTPVVFRLEGLDVKKRLISITSLSSGMKIDTVPIGYGACIPITEDEANVLLEHFNQQKINGKVKSLPVMENTPAVETPAPEAVTTPETTVPTTPTVKATRIRKKNEDGLSGRGVVLKALADGGWKAGSVEKPADEVRKSAVAALLALRPDLSEADAKMRVSVTINSLKAKPVKEVPAPAETPAVEVPEPELATA